MYTIVSPVHKPVIATGSKPFQHQVTGASKQIGVNFIGKLPRGYIPHTAVVPRGVQREVYLDAVSKITNSENPNYLGCRIAIESNFNIDLWKQKLRDYDDQHLVNLLQFGFPLGITDRRALN